MTIKTTRNAIFAALAACVLLPAAAQSTSYTPTAREAQQAHENAMRDAKLADAMEKARLKQDDRPVSVYIPKEKPQPEIKEHKPDVFMAGMPGVKKKKKKDA